VSFDRDEVLARQKRGLREWIESMADSSPDAELFEREGVAGAVVPSCPRRSIANSVSYDDHTNLSESLDALADRYEAAGVEAWTVWAPEFDTAAIEALEGAGHSFDGSPAAMALDLEDWTAPELGDLNWDADGDGVTLGRINEAAYGLTGAPAAERMAAGLAEPPDYMRLYRARVDGEVACVLGTIDHGDDLGFYFVATDPAHRGRGLARRLMLAALADARERGARSSNLQASKMGEPLYERMGYETYFRLHMYERRRQK
jgi:GNAT superfamily N-acetyltransferase